MGGCFRVFVLVGAILVSLGAGAFWLLSRPPEAARQLTPVAVSDAAAMSFDQKVLQLQAAPEPMTIEITEQEATSKLVAMLAAEPNLPKIENPQMAFRDGKVILSGISHDAPIPITVIVTGYVEARDGKLVTTIERIDTGRFPLPGTLQTQITDLATNTNRLNEELPIVVNDVRVVGGRLILTGQPK